MYIQSIFHLYPTCDPLHTHTHTYIHIICFLNIYDERPFFLSFFFFCWCCFCCAVSIKVHKMYIYVGVCVCVCSVSFFLFYLLLYCTHTEYLKYMNDILYIYIYKFCYIIMYCMYLKPKLYVIFFILHVCIYRLLILTFYHQHLYIYFVYISGS